MAAGARDLFVGALYERRNRNATVIDHRYSQLFAYNCHRNPASVQGVAMFEEKNSLPGSELHFSIHNRDGLARSRQNHPDVGGHVIAAFRAVREVIGIFWHEADDR